MNLVPTSPIASDYALLGACIFACAHGRLKKTRMGMGGGWEGDNIRNTRRCLFEDRENVLVKSSICW